MKTLLVLAASEHQIPVILAGKKLGARVLTTDNRPDNPGHPLAHEAFGIDTTAPEAVLELARAQGIDGIISACTDVAVPTAAYVSEQLGLPGIPLRAAQICTDKLKFRAFLDEVGLANPAWAEVRDGEPLPTKLLDDGPCALKPATSSGSKGIFVVHDVAALTTRLPDTMAFCRDGRAVLERWIDGWQGTVEGILRDGKVAWGMVTERVTAPLPHTATWGHVVPSGLDDATIEALRGTINRLFAALKVSDGPFDCDFVVRDGQAFILEMSPRLGGNALSDLARLAADIDLPDYAVKAALGIDSTVSASPIRPTAAVLLGVQQVGKLAYNEHEVAPLRTLPWVASLTFDKQPGDDVAPFINGRHRVAAALITADERATLLQRRDELRRRLNIRAV